MELVWLLVGLALLIGSGDALVRGAVAISLRFGLSALVVSATVVAFGTSAPELLVAIESALKGAPGIAYGNVVGSNIANVLLVLGIPALIAPLPGCGKDAHRNVYFMVVATLMFTVLVLMGTLTWVGGAVLLGIALFIVWDTLRIGRKQGIAEADAAEELSELEDVDPNMAPWKLAGLLAFGLIGLPVGAQLLIDSAREIALSIGVSEAVIGLTLVAIGTSLPELATTVMAALRRQADVAIGNVIGSNIFNITAIIGSAALFAPLPVPAEILTRDIWVMVGSSALLLPFILACKSIGRIAGGGFLLLYAVYIYVAFY